MMSRRIRPLAWAAAAALVLAAWATACSREPISPEVVGILAGKGGPSASPTVTGTDPAEAPQGTTLDVRVFGTNFDRGSKAELGIGGVVTTKVKTNGTSFVSSNELVANITVADDADTGLYDVIVTISSGKKGIGTEMFEVKAGTAGEKTYTFDDDISLYKVRSDARGTYVARVDCVAAFSDVTGLAMLRTIRNSPVCQAQVRGVWRFLSIDNTGIDLDQDGTAESSEAAPASFATSELYAHNATTTPVSGTVFHVNSDGTTTADFEWFVTYANRAPISTDPVTGAKTLTLTGSAAAADICRVDQRTGKCTKSPPTRVVLPFRVTVAPKP